MRVNRLFNLKKPNVKILKNALILVLTSFDFCF